MGIRSRSRRANKIGRIDSETATKTTSSKYRSYRADTRAGLNGIELDIFSVKMRVAGHDAKLKIERTLPLLRRGFRLKGLQTKKERGRERKKNFVYTEAAASAITCGDARSIARKFRRCVSPRAGSSLCGRTFFAPLLPPSFLPPFLKMSRQSPASAILPRKICFFLPGGYLRGNAENRCIFPDDVQGRAAPRSFQECPKTSVERIPGRTR